MLRFFYRIAFKFQAKIQKTIWSFIIHIQCKKHGNNLTVNYRSKVNINTTLGDNVNFIKTLSPALDPFDLGDETLIDDDSSIQTELQASDKADALTPRMEGNEVIARLTLDYSNPNQNYSNIKVGSTVILMPFFTRAEAEM